MKVAHGVREIISDDGAALLDIEQGLCFSLNPVGAKIWDLVKRGYSPNHIIESLEVDFHLPHMQVVSDVSEFLKKLHKLRLVGEQPLRPTKPGLVARLLTRNRSAE